MTERRTGRPVTSMDIPDPSSRLRLPHLRFFPATPQAVLATGDGHLLGANHSTTAELVHTHTCALATRKKLITSLVLTIEGRIGSNMHEGREFSGLPCIPTSNCYRTATELPLLATVWWLNLTKCSAITSPGSVSHGKVSLL